MREPESAFRFLTDEDFDGPITRGLLRRLPDVSLVRVQDVGLMGQLDPDVLAWAAGVNRVVLTHDVNTMTHESFLRTRRGLPMPRLIVVPRRLSVGQAIDALVFLCGAGTPEDVQQQVLFLPL